MNLFKIFLVFFFSVLFSISGIGLSDPSYVIEGKIKWEKVAEGIEFTEIPYNRWLNKGTIYGIKIDSPRKLKILVDTKKATSLEDLEKKYNSLITINGSYFEEKFEPVGLLKVSNKVLHKVNKVGSSGILAIADDKVDILHKKNLLSYQNNYTELMQNGPLLVENNGKVGIYSNDHEYTTRTVIGKTFDNKTIIVVTDPNSSMSLWEMANLLTRGENKGGFSCKTALNLDGGSSTGLRIKLPSKRLILQERDYIANGIGIF